MTHPTSDTLFVGPSELAGLMRETDWRHTPPGPPDTWPQSVRAIIRMMLTSRYTMWMGWGPDLTFFYNDAYARMTLGAKHPWALGKPAQQVWAEIWGDIGPRIEHVLATGDATWDEGLRLFLERSGFPEETYHTFSYSPLHEDDGRIAGMFCVVTEETHRVIGERRLALLRVLGSRLAASQTTSDVWEAVRRTLATDGRDLPFALVYLFDTEAGTATLTARSNVDGRDPVAPETTAIADGLWPLQRMLEGTGPGGTVISLPARFKWPSGPWQKAPTQAIVLPLAQPGQARPAGVFIAGLNPHRPVDAEFESFVTLFVGQLAAGLANAQAYMNERLRAEALAQIDRAKTTFFSNVSHELRTPLTLILGPIADAIASEPRTLAGDALDLVYRNGLRLRKLVNALLDFSRLEAGRVEASYEPVNLGAYTAEIASTFRSVVEGAGVRFTLACPPDDAPTYVDREMWEKIVLNLVSNAFKFTLAGEIALFVEPGADGVRLRVRDTGAGIFPAELPRIFERFHRVEGTPGRTHEGTGIGLALVQELVKLHGGTIDVESVLGRGTTFTVSMRRGTAHLPTARIKARQTAASTVVGADAFVEEAARWTRDEPGPDAVVVDGSVSGDASGALVAATRILLVDDNADMRHYLHGLLGRHWQVEVAADGQEALERARTHLPDLVITDMMMPRLDGLGLLRELRADERTRAVPVMMLSARAGEDSRLEGFQAGADEYLAKPFTARELVARVEAQLLRARVRGIEERSARRVASVFAQTPVPIAVLRGPEHVFTLANESCLALAGRPLVGQGLLQAVPELVGQGIVEMLDGVYVGGQPFLGRSVPVALKRAADGVAEPRFFDIACQPLFDDAGGVEGIAAVVYEVTELATARQVAESANRTKDEFLAMLGHELRNPLAPILTALQLLRLRGVEGGEQERTIIERQVRHLVALVDDLLDVSRITRGKVRLSPASVDLSDIVARAIELASPLLEQHQHALVVDVPKDGLRLMADPARLAQVVSNLLTNAAKYTPPGGRIQVSARAEGDEAVLRVVDTGIGIDPGMLPSIFDLFTQDRQALDRAQGGLGLGLAIVRNLVGLHGGTVEARSAGPGRGSEFIVRLPRLASDVVPAHPPSNHSERPRAVSTGVRVLVVDDNADAAAMLAQALGAAGHVTMTAHDGPTALEAARGFGPDVALLDIGLPVMDGFELARKLRELPGLRGTRLIAISGYGQDHDRRQSAAAGFDAHLVKPVDLDRLNGLVVSPPEPAGR